MQAHSFALRSAIDVKLSRFSPFRATILNQIKIWFIQKAGFGVSRNTTRSLGSLKDSDRAFLLFRMPDFPFTARILKMGLRYA